MEVQQAFMTAKKEGGLGKIYGKDFCNIQPK